MNRTRIGVRAALVVLARGAVALEMEGVEYRKP